MQTKLKSLITAAFMALTVTCLSIGCGESQKNKAHHVQISETTLDERLTVSNETPSARRQWIIMTREGQNTVVRAFGAEPMQMDENSDRDLAANRRILDYFKATRDTFPPDVQVLIKPNSNVPYRDVIMIYDYCKEAKFQQVAFAPTELVDDN